MPSSFDGDQDDEEDVEEPHMLAVDSGGDSLHGEEGDIDNHEEMLLMHTKEATGNAVTPPPPPPDYDEPACFVEPPAPPAPANKPVDDSFESYIFDSDGEDDFQTRGRNHVIPVINSSPTKKRRPGSSDNMTDPSTSPQTPSPRSSRGSPGVESSPKSPHGSPGKSFTDRKTAYGDMYISPPSSSEYGASPRGADGGTMPQSAFYPSDLNGRAYSSPVLQAKHTSMLGAMGRPTSPYSMHQSAPPMAYAHDDRSQPPTIPDGKTPIVLENPQTSPRQPSEASKAVVMSSSTMTRPSKKGYTCGMRTPVFWVLLFYVVFVTVAFAVFLAEYVQSASLRAQVEQLSEEVDRLEEEVDELEELILQLNKTVIDLSEEVAELQVENDQLEAQNAVLEQANENFNASLAELQQQADDLQGKVSNLTLVNEELKEEAFNLGLLYEELNNMTVALNETNTELAEQAQNLTIINEELVEENEELRNATDALQETLSEAVAEFEVLGETVIELEDQVAVLQEENSQLKNLTDSLGIILSFLEETNEDASVTAEELAIQLEQRITESRELVLQNLQNTMIQRTQSWNCDYVNAFAGASFVEDYSVPIESGSYDSVMDYVESRGLTGLCLDRPDFELFLSVNYMPNGDGLTSNELISGVSRYTTDALDYYFPDLNEPGVTTEEWAEAAYDCTNFTEELQYRFDQ